MNYNKEDRFATEENDAMDFEEQYLDYIKATQKVIREVMGKEDIVICSCIGPDFDKPFAGLKMYLETESIDKDGNAYAIEMLMKDPFVALPLDEVMEYYLDRCRKTDELDVIIGVKEDLFGLGSAVYEVPYTRSVGCRKARIFFITYISDFFVRPKHSVLYERALNILRRRRDMCC